MHRRDCVSYLLVNDRVVVEWWVEYKVTYDVQWQEDTLFYAYVAERGLVDFGLWMQLYKCFEKAVLLDACTENLSCPGAGKPSMICCSKW
jgi:hypothetical protein